MDPKLSLAWDAHQKNICNGLSLLQQRGEFVDMTLAADGHHVKVHQMVMSLVSPFVKELITSANCPHPVIFLNRVSYRTLELILEYAYTGEVLVPRVSLHEFLEACKVLHIKGLEDESIKAAADGAMLSLMNDGNDQPSTTVAGKDETPVMTGVKRKRTTIDDIDQTYDDFNVAESNISDDALDDYVVETLDDPKMDENTEIDKKQEETDKYAKAKEIQMAAGSTVQYTLSCQGSIQVILNRYIYRLRHSRKNNEKMYRCAEYNKKGCPAYVFTKGDVIITRGCAHNHPFHDKQILKRVQNGNVFTHYKAAQNVATLNKKSSPTGKTKSDEMGED